MTQEEFDKQDLALKEAFRRAVRNNNPKEATELVKQHRELCKSFKS